MAKVPLRVYNNDIEKLIENGQVQEAIAHCRHILKIFPKHIDTYRLLGKAFLESQRYAEAVDILQRVLSVLPDDFISHLGMSIIREDEGNLDAAIFHMEKAFEIQPASPAIQGELRRLFGRRDGVEPPRIRLNRGALVRMYTRGELYPQAIAETRAALQEDTQRTDLQAILARLYFLSGQKVQAVEMASQLVAKLPFCYEANRILAEVLPGSARAEEAKVYRQRLEALDPYTGLITPAMPTSADVPDVAVQVERLEYDAALDTASSPEWAQAAGISWEDSAEESTPEWLTPDEESRPSATAGVEIQPEASSPAAEAEIPEWMSAAGWSPAEPGSESKVETSILGEEDQSDLASTSEIPDWLKSLAPTPELTGEQKGEDAEEDNEWFAKLTSEKLEAETTSPKAMTPDEGHIQADGELLAAASWLEEPAPTGVQGSQDVEDVIGQPVEGESGTLPDWLKEIGVPEQASAGEGGTQDGIELEDADIPDWLATPETVETVELETTAGETETLAETDAIPDWLKALAPEQPLETEAMFESEAATAAGEDLMESEPAIAIPESLESQETAAAVETAASLVDQAVPVEAQPEDDMEAALAWLEALAAKQGADEETLLTPLAERSESMPDWLNQEASGDIQDELEEIEPQAAEALTELPAMQSEQPAGVVESLPEEAEPLESADMDAALAWLENLAARQGADEGTLLVKPEERSETPPEWVTQTADSNLEAVLPIETTAEAAGSEVEDLEPSWAEMGDAVPEISAETTEFDEELAGISMDADLVSDETVSLAEIKLEGPIEEPFEQIPGREPVGDLATEAIGSLDDVETVWAEEKPDEPMLPLETEALAGVFTDEGWLDAESGTEDEAAAKTQPIRIAMETIQEKPAEPIEAVLKVPGEITAEEKPSTEGWQAESLAGSESDDSGLPAWLSDLEQETIVIDEGGEEGETELPDWLKDLEVPTQTSGEVVIELKTPEWIYEDASAVQEIPAAAETEVSFQVEPEAIAAAEMVADEAVEMPETAETPRVTEFQTEALTETTDETEPVVIDEPSVEAEQEPGVGEEAAVEVEQAPAAEIIEEAEPVAAAEVTTEEAEAVIAEVTIEEALAGEAEEEITAEPEMVVSTTSRLGAAQQALQKGNVDQAVEEYNQMIQSGEMLEEAIHDLRDATYRFPVDTNIWQALGDAYLRSNRLQDALDAYTKAEELLR